MDVEMIIGNITRGGIKYRLKLYREENGSGNVARLDVWLYDVDVKLTTRRVGIIDMDTLSQFIYSEKYKNMLDDALKEARSVVWSIQRVIKTSMDFSMSSYNMPARAERDDTL